jgi:hypothetical protein
MRNTYTGFVGKPLGKVPEDIDVHWIILLKRTSDKVGGLVLRLSGSG